MGQNLPIIVVQAPSIHQLQVTIRQADVPLSVHFEQARGLPNAVPGRCFAIMGSSQMEQGFSSQKTMSLTTIYQKQNKAYLCLYQFIAKENIRGLTRQNIGLDQRKRESIMLETRLPPAEKKTAVLAHKKLDNSYDLLRQCTKSGLEIITTWRCHIELPKYKPR